MAGSPSEDFGAGRSSEEISGGGQRGEALAEWRSSEQVEISIPSTSPPYWDTDDDDDDCGSIVLHIFNKFGGLRSSSCFQQGPTDYSSGSNWARPPRNLAVGFVTPSTSMGGTKSSFISSFQHQMASMPSPNVFWVNPGLGLTITVEILSSKIPMYQPRSSSR